MADNPASSTANGLPKSLLFGTDASISPTSPDAVLRYADHSRGFAELRVPKGGGSFPLAVVFHGGCWKTGIATQAYMAPLATRWQQAGIATLNVDYREVGDGGGWPGSFADWLAASGLIAEAARRYPLDLTRLTLVGHSAGATPAQWLAAEQDAQGPLGSRPALRPSGIIVFDGAADLALEAPAFDRLCKFGAVAPFMGGSAAEMPARYQAISPTLHPPFARRVLFVQAVMPTPAQTTQEAIRASGAAVQVIEHPGASHFAVITPGSSEYLKDEPAILALLRGAQ